MAAKMHGPLIGPCPRPDKKLRSTCQSVIDQQRRPSHMQRRTFPAVGWTTNMSGFSSRLGQQSNDKRRWIEIAHHD